MTPPRRALIIFARAPELGRVKTRLAAELGDEGALRAYRKLGRRVMAAAVGVPHCEITVAYTPPSGGEAVREWLGPVPMLRPQREGDLGERMSAAIGEALAAGADRVVVIGTDCPDVSAATIACAFERLDDFDVVIGPATDGGYYLIGMTRLHRELFDGIPWSSPDTLDETLAAATARGLRVSLLDMKRDIDTAADWRDWLAR